MPDRHPGGALDDLGLPDELWAAFGIPIGLAFFIRSSATGEVGRPLPEPGGATECELDLDSWQTLRSQNPILDSLEADAEALIVNRIAKPAATRSRRSTSATAWSG